MSCASAGPTGSSPAGDGVILNRRQDCRDASPEGFGRAIWNLSYHLAAWYTDGFERRVGPEGLRLRLRRRRVRLAA